MNWRKFRQTTAVEEKKEKKYEKCRRGNQTNAFKWKKAVEKFCLLKKKEEEEEDGKNVIMLRQAPSLCELPKHKFFLCLVIPKGKTSKKEKL